MGRQPPPEDPPPCAPEWIVTFSDMISLLVTFFVMLLTFSSSAPANKLTTSNWNRGMGGSLHPPRLPSSMEAPDLLETEFLLRGAQNRHARLDGLADDISGMGQRTGDGAIEADFTKAADGLLLRFGDENSFAPGSSELSAPMVRSLAELAEIVRWYPAVLVFEGHVGEQDHAKGAQAELLACDRARRAASQMLQQGDYPADLVQFSVGQPEPGEKAIESGPASRRVDVRIQSLSVQRQAALEARRGEQR